MIKKKILFGIILSLTSLGHIASDIYLPSLPAIATGLNTTITLTQLSISFYMFGFCLSQLIYGPLSDGIGRIKPLIIGLTICLIGSIICSFSNSIYMFITGRIIQGLGAGVGVSLSRAILRDIFKGEALAKFASYLSIFNIAMISSAPILGGYFEHFGGWQTSFFFLTIYVIIMIICIFTLLPETNDYINIDNLKLVVLKNNFITLISNPLFMGYSFFIFFSYGGVVAWLTVCPFLLQDIIGLSPIEFGWIATLEGVAYSIGSLINVRLIKKFNPNSLIKMGLLMMLFSGILLYGLGLLYLNTLVIIIPIFVFQCGTSFIFPNAFAGAFKSFSNIAGTASALYSAIQILGGAVFSGIVSYTNSNNQLSLAILLSVSSMISLIILYFLKKKQ